MPWPELSGREGTSSRDSRSAPDQRPAKPRSSTRRDHGSLQRGAPGRDRAPRAPYLPLLQPQPCCSRGLKAARHIPIASHRIPVCQRPPTSLSSGSCRTAKPRLLCAGCFTGVWERPPLISSGHPGAARYPPARRGGKQELPGCGARPFLSSGPRRAGSAAHRPRRLQARGSRYI